jgi:hypothetical protein
MLRPALATIALLAIATGVAAQDTGRPMHLPDLRGTWTGKADFMLPDGIVEQTQRFEITTQTEAFLRGEHSWAIPSEALQSHDGSTHTFAATEPFLGVIDHDGTIWLVEHGDHSIFRLDLVNRYTMELIVLEGGEHPLVGHGVLVRE